MNNTNDILWRAVRERNVTEVEKILKQCTQEILEFRGGQVCIYVTCIYVTCIYANNLELLLLMALTLHVLASLIIFISYLSQAAFGWIIPSIQPMAFPIDNCAGKNL